MSSSSPSSEEWELVPLTSMLAWGECPEMYLSYGSAALKGKCPALTDAVTTVPSFTLLSPPMGLDYFGVYDGFFGPISAKHLAERLHVAVAMRIHDELVDEAPRFLQFPDDVEGWWRKTVLDAFRAVDDELVARVATGGAAGSPAVVALVMEDHLVLANRGGTCRAVIYRDEEAVQLTPEPRPESYKQNVEQNVQNTGGHVVGSSCNLEDDTATSRTISLGHYFPEPEVLMVTREPRDKFLILATGRFWDEITPDQACSFIQNRLRTSHITMPWKQTALDNTGSPAILAEELAEHAIRKASQAGNVTVAIVLFNNFWDEHHP